MTDRFIEKPNLPCAKVKTVLMSDRNPEMVRELEMNFHIEVISPKPLESISGAERFHADMCVCHLRSDSFCVNASDICLTQALMSYGGKIIETDHITAADPLLNVCILGDKIICNKNRTDKNIIRYCLENLFTLLHTNQRYAKCSTAVLTENAVITSDESIFRLCMENDIDVLKISPGSIKLDGYPYGFIGGCCGLADKDILVFSGNIKVHPEYDNIKAFAGNHAVHIESIGTGGLYDIGGILPIRESV